jgi:hypothetical protein
MVLAQTYSILFNCGNAFSNRCIKNFATRSFPINCLNTVLCIEPSTILSKQKFFKNSQFSQISTCSLAWPRLAINATATKAGFI